MKFILTPNKDDATKLIRITPQYNDRLVGFNKRPDLYNNSEDQYITWVVNRNKETGLIPCESTDEYNTLIAKWTAANPNSDHKTRRPYHDGKTYWIVDASDLPGGKVTNDNDYFFEAWEWVDNGVIVNMPKARNIHMDQIRIIRNRELAAKDITFMRAVEDGNADAQATIKTEKQNLRDIPQTFDITTGVDTPEQLKAKWPDGLPKE